MTLWIVSLQSILGKQEKRRQNQGEQQSLKRLIGMRTGIQSG
jgi:hypothetical protein